MPSTFKCSTATWVNTPNGYSNEFNDNACFPCLPQTPMAVAPWAGPASCSSGAQSSPPSPTRERQGRQSGWRSSPLPSQPIVTVPGFKTDRVKKKGKGKAQFKKGGAKDATKPKKVKEKQEEEKLDEEQGQTSWRRGHEHRLSNC